MVFPQKQGAVSGRAACYESYRVLQRTGLLLQDSCGVVQPNESDVGLDVAPRSFVFAGWRGLPGEAVAPDSVRTLRAGGLGNGGKAEPRWAGEVRGQLAWRDLVCTDRPWPCEWALSVVACESSNDPLEWATEWYQGQQWYFHGLWQIASLDPDPGPLADPVYNTERAEEKYLSGGATHWLICGMGR